MTQARRSLSVVVIAVGLIWASAPAAAQSLGVFRWQLLPYCNILTLTIVEQNGLYTLDGTDDRCGAAQAASAVGTAFLNPDGTVGFGITSVLADGTPLHLSAAISMGSLGGNWRDSAGNSGTLVMLPAGGLGGSPRPFPSEGVAAGSITAVQLAGGAVTASALAGGAITAPSIANGAVGASALAVGAVTAPALASNAVDGGHVVDGSLTRADLGDAPRVASVENGAIVTMNGTSVMVAQVNIVAPAAGRVIVNASGFFNLTNTSTIEAVFCSLTTGLGLQVPYSAAAYEQSANSLYQVPFGGTRTFSVATGSSTNFRLICYGSTGAQVWDTSLNALFIAGQ